MAGGLKRAPPTLLRAMNSDGEDLPSVHLKSVSPSETVSFRLAADRVCLCRERRECDPPDSTTCNREQAGASVVRAAGSRRTVQKLDAIEIIGREEALPSA